MARTFVRVELVERDSPGSPFALAMAEMGFMQTITGKPSRRALRLPDGMYYIDAKSPTEALSLTRIAAAKADVQARIFCVPAGGDVRFGNLELDESVAFEPA
jgi:hypothetical protein